ncbi:YheC/YheD family endospore coat-associated protein [Bacillus massilinigeriensis]|uniref:YheC/YheD family endospore coat-associated protein n=1 Tax=Bacillus mediterraneensis TaxID=1805474 RepID=UPI0008F83779|nr:YheC/YheD family protein [Bacillus mediterraneensis]
MKSEVQSDNEEKLPIIAVLVQVKGGDQSSPNFGNLHSFCIELSLHAIDAGILLYVFTLDGIADDGINGYRLENRQWAKELLPYPDIVYNRLYSRKTETGKKFSKFLKLAAHQDIVIFNSHFLHKWEVHQLLSKHEGLESHLPETSLYSPEALSRMMCSGKTVYLKPIHGSLGKKIIRLTSNEDNIIADFSAFPNEKERIFPTVKEAANILPSLLGREIFIIQRGIPLITQNGKPIDFRVLCHIDSSLIWKTTSIIARIAGEGDITSNLSRGGKTEKPIKVLLPLFGREKSTTIYNNMKKFAIAVSEIISEHCSGTFGELGVDIGVDVAGEIWLIETNSKPSKNFPMNDTRIRPSAKSIIECSRGLYKKTRW